MKVTSIKQQVKRAGRYAIFVDNKYAFSLSDTALLDSKLYNGQELSKQQMENYKQASVDDKLYNQVLNYLAIRPRTEWEINTYLKRKKASPTLSSIILNKLSINNLIDDEKFARAFVNDRALLRPTSRRKLILELRQKRVKDEIVQEIIGDLQPDNDLVILLKIVESKRKQSKYKDDMKLMQYLARQGFNYGDIKSVLQAQND